MRSIEGRFLHIVCNRSPKSYEIAETLNVLRCIKPNETKKAHDWEELRVKHQVEYLGLKENIRVRRAGFAYRRPFAKFLQRYAILTRETWPAWTGEPARGIKHIMDSVTMEPSQWQMGVTKIFIKAPESLFLLEETRERKFDGYARTIQTAWRRYVRKREMAEIREKATDILFNKKMRRRASINRCFVGDYIGFGNNAGLRALVGKRERIEFACCVNKYDRRFRVQKRDLLLSGQNLYLIGRERVKKGPQAGELIEKVMRKIELSDIVNVDLSTRQDDFFVIRVREAFPSILESVFKTEFLTVLSEKFTTATGNPVNISFSDQITYTAKKDNNKMKAWIGSLMGDERVLQFVNGNEDFPTLTAKGKMLTIAIGNGLPRDTRPGKLSVRQGSLNKQKPPRSAQSYQYQPPGSQRGSAKMSRSSSSMERPSMHKIGAKQSARNLGPQASNQSFMRVPSPNMSVKKKGPPPPPPPQKNYPKVQALYDYQAQDAEELTIRAGDMIDLLRKEDSGWWVGELSGRKGLFPFNYVQEL